MPGLLDIVPRRLLDQNVLFCAIESRDVDAVREYLSAPHLMLRWSRFDAANMNTLGGLPIIWSALLMLTHEGRKSTDPQKIKKSLEILELLLDNGFDQTLYRTTSGAQSYSWTTTPPSNAINGNENFSHWTTRNLQRVDTWPRAAALIELALEDGFGDFPQIWDSFVSRGVSFGDWDTICDPRPPAIYTPERRLSSSFVSRLARTGNDYALSLLMDSGFPLPLCFGDVYFACLPINSERVLSEEVFQ